MATNRIGRSLQGFSNELRSTVGPPGPEPMGLDIRNATYRLALNPVDHFSAVAFRRKTVPISIVGFVGKSVEKMILPFNS
jgi:hypothetical protein